MLMIQDHYIRFLAKNEVNVRIFSVFKDTGILTLWHNDKNKVGEASVMKKYVAISALVLVLMFPTVSSYTSDFMPQAPPRYTHG
ncbi:hypothetical protein MM221_07860 [Salipaludibacillus sp. LMS25]|jgi:hypothetical protein|uniref:hypothetical protein n=1 Tax=Salipaludibacillus sp. LMS25 TaxID=2924031 RepID=UPI0020D1B461|nr:hypothetical protein [Salipaludibacillus sp. LMS25]UTR16446.1 hypothetical protein MM221_07860 [Salipaludibacillus sp. LMS25]